jgi:hypothetical protein
MSSGFNSSSSGIARLVFILAASVMTAALFSAVVFGLTGEEGWSLLAESGVEAAVQA